ncbi:TIGR02301 family protein [Methylovirgula sp. HY1]|uniref:TIGR02301 family protein n=1 Tax=Methylovirgula sp. HY1 TaxID=2822761 RepID=UPI001C5B27CC|nr:TIGR02301 family protein [Methylovirgula sp. HY1]QXX73455.1 hypothetical protein MHY1_00251 [Methylovirgula sp. HY1]
MKDERAIRLRFAASLATSLLLSLGSAPPVAAAPAPLGHAATKEKSHKSDKDEKATAPAVPAVETAPPYEPQLLRLSEMLGALAYLQDLCGHHHDGQIWRAKMAALIAAEAKTSLRKERLAGAFNRGFRGYALTYRLCTPNAQAIITRFLDESGKLAHDVAHRYGPG